MEQDARRIEPLTASPQPQRELAMRRLTWMVLGLAFAAWLVLAGGATLWALSFAQAAAAPAPSTLERVSGVVLYREVDRRDEASAHQGLQVFDGDELATSFGSSATLRVFDGSLLQIYPNARLRIDATRVGRFNPSATQAAFTLLTGAMHLSVPQVWDKPHTLNVATPHGAGAFVPGEYTLRVEAGATRISVWEGRAAVAAGDQTVDVAQAQKVILGPGEGDWRVGEALENVLVNGDFAGRFQGWEPWEDREQGRPDVPGRLDIVVPEGTGAPSRSLRVTRRSERAAHNETGLRQRVDRPVSGARAIRIEALVRVDLASLSGGGYLGSEYPIMIRIRVRDSLGGEQIWTQGFYFANPENRPVPIGQRVERGVWVPFAAELTPALRQPSVIEAIEVFGAGHTFDAAIGDIRLLVD